MFQRNQELQLHYPTSTLIGADLEFKPRTLIVKYVRDLRTNPLTIEDFFRRPLIHRGRWLLGVLDLDSREFRSIYPTTSREHFDDAPLRIGLYESFGNEPIDILSRHFQATARERMLLAKTLFKWSELDLDGLKLGVFAENVGGSNEEA